MAMVARNFELELDPTAGPVTELFGFTMSPGACGCGCASARRPRTTLRSDEIREVAGAGQRLPDRRGGGASLGSDAGAGRAALRPALRDRRRRRPAALARARTPSSSPTCGSSTRTARRPSCRATARGRRSSTCAATAGPTPTSSRSDRRRADPADDHRSELTCSVEMGRASTASKDFPSGGADGRGTLSAGGPRVGVPARLDRQPAVRDRGRRERARDARPGGDRAARSKATTLFPNRTNVSFLRVDGSTVRARIFERGVGETLSSGTGACGAAVDRLPARRAQPDHGRARRRGAEVEIGEDLRRAP